MTPLEFSRYLGHLGISIHFGERRQRCIRRPCEIRDPRRNLKACPELLQEIERHLPAIQALAEEHQPGDAAEVAERRNFSHTVLSMAQMSAPEQRRLIWFWHEGFRPGWRPADLVAFGADVQRAVAADPSGCAADADAERLP